jgi:chromosomal replication initiator protein
MTLADINNPYIGVYFASLRIIGSPELKDIIRQVCAITTVPEEKLKERTRKPDVVFARQMCWRLVKEYKLPISAKRMGQILGGQDHSTILYGFKTICDRIETDDAIRMTYEQIKKSLRVLIRIDGETITA